MTLVLPIPSGSPISQWAVTDWGTPNAVTPPAAAGRALVNFGTLDTGTQWLVDRAVIVCDSTTDTALRLYADEVSTRNLLSGSDRGNFDEAEYPSGLLIRGGSALLAVWTGCSAGAVATIRLQTRVMRQVTG
jgi:hypothetical protein